MTAFQAQGPRGRRHLTAVVRQSFLDDRALGLFGEHSKGHARLIQARALRRAAHAHGALDVFTGDGVVGVRITSRSIRLRSSRTLPGKGWRVSALIAEAVRVMPGRALALRALSKKCSASFGMSSRRARSGGSSSGTTFRRSYRSARNRPFALA